MGKYMQITPVLRDKKTTRIVAHLVGVSKQEEALLLKIHPDWYRSIAEENYRLPEENYESDMIIEKDDDALYH